MPQNPSLGGRVHIVLVPGFVGFDALGQLEYYAGVTPQIQRWKKLAGNNDSDVDLRYFDNFPTAAVRTRAGRLANYLAKRMARCEFLPGDSIALVGHSTGGLDIRWLIWELSESPHRTFPVDGAIDSDSMIAAEDLLALIKRVVFLSVPQWGTNIADWVRSYKIGRKFAVGDLRWGFAGSQVPVVAGVEKWTWNWLSSTSRLGIAYAVRDTISEAEAGASHDPTQVADAQEAASEVQLWLRYMTTDFHAIDDLAVGGNDCPPQTPARFGKQMRRQEMENWTRAQIVARSYMTLGPRLFKFTPGKKAPRWDLLNPLTYPDCTPRERPSPEASIAYRIVYRACAGGPFEYPNGNPPPVTKVFSPAGGGVRKIELWDNDGIVNTASMFWPEGETLLVEGDHLDIVGHYKNVHSADKCSRRKYQAYDLLESGSQFDDGDFELVWNNIFDFCAGKNVDNGGPPRRTRRKAVAI